MERTSRTQAPTKKPRGRPAGVESADSRSAILDAAEMLFAHNGYAGTSTRAIADQVEVNPAMIHYYFGSKNALLEQVLDRALEPLALAIAGMRAADRAPASEIARNLLRTLSERPHLPSLVVREVMLPGGAMREHFLDYLAPRLGGALPGLLEAEQADGRMDSKLDSHISTLIILSLCVFPFIAREMAGPALQISYDEAGLERLERHITRLLDEGFTT